MFLYFTSNGDVPPAELDYALERGRVTVRQVSAGPDGRPGKVMCDVGFDRCGYYEDQQDWRQIPGTSHWLGVFRDAVPGPEQLRRDKMLAGHQVMLGDGNTWTVPVARAMVDDDGDARWIVALPRVVDVDDAGRWVYGAVLPRYRKLWEIGQVWWDHVVAGVVDDSGHVIADVRDPQWAYTAATEVLQANYRIGPAELGMMGAYHTDSFAEVLNAVIDYPRLLELLEKKKQNQAA